MSAPMINHASGCSAGAPTSGCDAGHGGQAPFQTERGSFESRLDQMFNGSQQPGGDPETLQLLTEIKDMLARLLEQKGDQGSQGAGANGAADCGCPETPEPEPKPAHDDHGHQSCAGGDKPECGGAQGHEAEEEEPAEEQTCGSTKPHDCGEGDEVDWDGENKSPSLDRERAAARFLEQAQNTDDPEQKRELIDMAMDMLEQKKEKKISAIGIGDWIKKADGNSYDKDVVKQAEKMLDQIDDGKLDPENEAKMLDSVIDMLMTDGGVDGKPAASDTNGNGWNDRWDDMRDRPVSWASSGVARDYSDDR